jgi:hypothetical protein
VTASAGPAPPTPASVTNTSIPEVLESPQAQFVSTDNTEEFPALPTATIETSSRPTPTQPPFMPKPPPAPPVTRKASSSTKVVKVEPKKPTLPPLTTASIAKAGQSTEPSPLVELASAKAESKGKKTGNETATTYTPITPVLQPSGPSRAGKHSEPASASGSKLNAVRSKEAKPAATSAVATTQTAALASEPVEHAPIVARQTKKSKPQQLPKKKQVIVREESAGPKENTPEPQATAALPAGAEASATPQVSAPMTNLGELLGQLRDHMDIRSLRFFKESSLSPKEPAEFKQLVEPISLLSATRQHYVYYDEASDEIDDALVAFEKLLTTVTKTISDLLKLMPRTTPLDRAMWDIVMKEMVKAGFMTSNHTLKDWAAAIRAEDHPELEKKIAWLEKNCKLLVFFWTSAILMASLLQWLN